MIGINAHIITEKRGGVSLTCINFKLSFIVNVISARFCKSEGWIVRLDSSNSSLTAASSTDSPGSIFPPNPFHLPFPKPRNCERGEDETMQRVGDDKKNIF